MKRLYVLFKFFKTDIALHSCRRPSWSVPISPSKRCLCLMFPTFPEDIVTFFDQWVFFNPKDMWQERWKITKQARRLPHHIIAKKVIARTQVDTTMCNCCRRRLPRSSVSCVSSSGREFCVKSLVTSRFLQHFSLSSGESVSVIV